MVRLSLSLFTYLFFFLYLYESFSVYTAVWGAIRPSTCTLFTYLTYSYTIFICLLVWGGCVAGWVCAVECTIHDLFIREAR